CARTQGRSPQAARGRSTTSARATPVARGFPSTAGGLVILEQLAQRHGGRLETRRDERGSQNGPTFTTTVLLDLNR
ncbi:MAG: hypothetical protein KHY83_11935, partial [Coriobacteriia bacterium]|nr:hypothetical protein [Coriobacteriia bacterium]